MKRLDKNVKRRNQIAKFYYKHLKDLPINLPWQDPNVYSSYHLYPITVDLKSSFKTQKQVYFELRKNKIAVNLHYIPVHRHPYYEKLGFRKNDYPISEKFHRQSISIPIFPSIKKKELEYIVKTIKKILFK